MDSRRRSVEQKVCGQFLTCFVLKWYDPEEDAEVDIEEDTEADAEDGVEEDAEEEAEVDVEEDTEADAEEDTEEDTEGYVEEKSEEDAEVDIEEDTEADAEDGVEEDAEEEAEVDIEEGTKADAEDGAEEDAEEVWMLQAYDCRAQLLRGRASDSQLWEPNFEPFAAVLKPWASFSTLHCSSLLSCINEYLALIVAYGWMPPREAKMMSKEGATKQQLQQQQKR